MNLSERKVGGVTVIDVSGKMAAGDGAGNLKDKVTSLVFQGEKNIILNVAELSYVDSSGLGEMVACHGTAIRGGGTVKIANMGKRLQDLMVMTKLLNVFEAHDSEDAAVRSFS
ncbi:MAG TPA: STAS domain-containing protein [Vicinamibacterales bacterium]|nr:STAS domain-containing protein [Vicinamibacterales bacterium]